MKLNDLFARWQSNFVAGLAAILPLAVSVGLLIWFFGTVSNVTDALLFFLPKHWTHKNLGTGAMYWYWSLAALLVAVMLVSMVGYMARYYIGKQLMQFADFVLLQVPLLNKIYGTAKQVNEAFTTGNKSSFKHVVLVEFPQPGQYAVGFLTGEPHRPMINNAEVKLVSVFIPTTPNPTSGFLILMPDNKVTHLDMTVADGLKYIISLGAIPLEVAAAKRGAHLSIPPAP